MQQDKNETRVLNSIGTPARRLNVIPSIFYIGTESIYLETGRDIFVHAK